LVDPYSCGKETCFELNLINPTGRELDPNNVQQNQSNSEWQAKLWSTSEMVRNLQQYLETTPKEQIQKEWELRGGYVPDEFPFFFKKFEKYDKKYYWDWY